MNGTDNRIAYRIKRIRLVNFHNFQNEIIELRDGGHLFLLGDNGSGKTTVLDAVHYVLTGGNQMEFNSAARMAGKRHQGRRAQGIVMRYNVDTGPMNPHGGVSYAACELTTEDGALLTIGVGVSAYSMEERLQRWGIIVSDSLDSIPWLIEEQEGIRVTSQKEMREALSSRNGFYTIGAYEKELARRLFNTDEIFMETCRFLSMGKAYREIAAQAADYHQLFKTLLPEPKTDLFDRIIEALRTLDEANALMDDMQKKLVYLATLENMVNTIDEHRESIARYNWLQYHLEKRTTEKKCKEITETIRSKNQEIETIRQRSARLLDERDSVSRQLGDLRSKDSAGLVRQEKDVSYDCNRKHDQAQQLAAAVDTHKNAFEQAQNTQESALKVLNEAIGEVHNLISNRRELTNMGCRAILEVLGSIPNLPDPRTAVSEIEFDRLQNNLQDQIFRAARERDRSNDTCAELASQQTEIKKEITQLHDAGDMRPTIDGYAETVKALDEAGIAVRALYELLEWNVHIDSPVRAAAEECIGMDILATLTVGEDDWEQTQSIVFTTAPGVRIAPLRVSDTILPDWLRETFSIEHSHPAALTILHDEMVSHKEPKVENFQKYRILSFRAHTRRLFSSPSKWIGQEERRRALELRIAELHKQLEQSELEYTEHCKKIDQLDAAIHNLNTLRDYIRNAERTLTHAVDRWVQAESECRYRKEMYFMEKQRLDELRGEIDAIETRLETLREMINREGLEDLDRRIMELEEHMVQLTKSHEELLRKEGGLHSIVDTLGQDLSDAKQYSKTLEQKLSEALDTVRILIKQTVDNIEYYILRTRGGAQFHSTENVQNAINDTKQKMAGIAGSLGEKLNDPVFGSVFGFHYDEHDNRLSDRRDMGVHELTKAQRTAITEQQDVINEKTNALFRKIIINEMVSFFARHLSRLDQMIRTINQYLSHRSFGTTRYRLELERVDRFRSFIDAVKGFNPFDSQSENILRQLIEDNRDEIIHSDMETVPPVLDYRNWYTYHLRMFTTNEQGVIMDRRTKSVGSGGEQAVPNYLTILTIAHFLFHGNRIRLHTLLFDEAFYGIDAGRRDQLLGFAGDLGLQLLVASPDQDGVKREVRQSTTLLVVKDPEYNVHLYPFHWENPPQRQMSLFETEQEDPGANVVFDKEIGENHLETDRYNHE